MARSADQIEADLSSSIELEDSSYDTTQGPIKDLFTIPLSKVISETEQEAEDLRKLFSLQFSESATDAEIRSALNNYGSQPNPGTKSSHIQYFMRFTKPKDDIIVPVGTLVSNISGTLVYRTIEEAVMIASKADTYYNASRKAYELPIKVEADGTGSAYALPSYRIQTILTRILGIDATENRTKSSQSLPEEDLSTQSNRLRTRLLGLNLNTYSGIESRIKENMSSVVSLVQVVPPSSPDFKRVLTRASIDVYVKGDLTQIHSDTITAISGQTEISFSKQPVVSVNSVLLNGNIPVTYTLVKDSSNDTGGSVSSQDYIVLGSPLNSGDIVEVSYNYNKLLEDVNTLVFNDSSESYFETSTLVREFIKVSPIIGLELKVVSSYSFDEVSSNIKEFIQTTLENFNNGIKIAPNDFRDKIIDNISGIQSLRVLKFRRDFGSLSNIEIIVLASNEIASYNEANIDVRAIR